MIQQNVLDLTPSIELPPSIAAAQTGHESVEYRCTSGPRRLQRRSVLDLGHLESVERWDLAPYRGSEFEILGTPSPRGRRKRRILVNQALPEVVRRELSRARRELLAISIGDPFDAYPSAEHRFGMTRAVLEALEAARGHRIDLTTRSPLVLRDQEILRRLDLGHSVTVRVPIATLDASLAARFEPETSTPAARLDMVRALARDGISVVVTCEPILPGINNSADELDPLFAAIRRAGALDVVAGSRLDAQRHRARVAAWLDRHFPAQKASTLGRLRQGGDAHATLERLRLSYGFPIQAAGRG